MNPVFTMMTIKTKEKASLWLAFVAAVVVALIMIVCGVAWWLIVSNDLNDSYAH